MNKSISRTKLLSSFLIIGFFLTFIFFKLDFFTWANSYIHSINTQWANMVVTSESWIEDISHDSEGNFYVVGYFENFDDDDPVLLPNNTQVEKGAFVAKYDYHGNLIWARTANDPFQASNYLGVSTFNSQVVAVGHIRNNEDINFGNNLIIDGSDTDARGIMLSTNTSGEPQWLSFISHSGNSQSEFSAIDFDSDGNIYVVGSLYEKDIFDFGNGILLDTNLYDDYSNVGFLAKYSPSGTVLWSKLLNNNGDLYIYDLKIDSQNNAILSGVQPDSSSTIEYENNASVEGRPQLLKFSNDGDLIWAKGIESAESKSSFHKLALDSQDNIYIAGALKGNNSIENFGNGVSLLAKNIDQALVASYSTNGDARWAKAASTEAYNYNSEFFNIAIRNSGPFESLYVVGYGQYNIPYDFGNGVNVSNNLSSDSSNYPIIVSFSTNGDALWAKSVNSSGGMEAEFKATSATSQGIFVGGFMSNSSYDFGNGNILSTESPEYTAMIAFYQETITSPTPDDDISDDQDGGGDNDDYDSNTESDNINTSEKKQNDDKSTKTKKKTDQPQCHAPAPIDIPDLFQINVNQNSATIFYTPILTNNNNYHIWYSTSENFDQHGVFTNQNNSTGVQHFDINQLKPNTTYYFKIRGFNDCQPGEWSSTIKVKTQKQQQAQTKPKIFYKYSFFR